MRPLPVAILGTGRSVAGDVIGTDALLRRLDPTRDPARLVERIGIDARHWLVADPDAPPLAPGAVTALAVPALRAAIEAAGIHPGDLRRIILATSTGGDQLIPSTATNIGRALGLSDTCDCFDVNNACTGFLNALDVACRSVATGLGPVAVVGAEVLSRYLRRDTPRSYLVLADAAAAVIVGAPSAGGRLLSSWLRMRSDLSGDMRTTHPGVTGLPSAITFDAPLGELAESAVRSIRDAGDHVLADAGLAWGDVDWFLPHQPNGALFEAIVARCGVDPARTVPVARQIGSVAAASVPFSLDVLRRSGRLTAGQRVLLAAVGAGTGYGALLFEVES